ncbi:MAG: acyltransferase [bacterium]|nr:acyltransferase [bacterium]
MIYCFNKIYYLFKYIYHRIFTPFYKIGWPVVFCHDSIVINSRYIALGNNVVIKENARIQVDHSQHLKFGNHKPKLKIGNNVTIGKGSTISAVSNIEIEDDAGMAGYCFIADNSHGYQKIDIPIKYQELTNIKPIKIKNGAWLGWGVVVMPGVTIGRNSVIGANSVVNSDVPDYSVAVGAPAKIVKRYDIKSKTWQKVK